MALNFEEQIKGTWWLFLGGAVANFAMIAMGWVKGPLKTWWTIGGVIGLALGGWGFMMANNMMPKSGYTYYYDGNYYFG